MGTRCALGPRPFGPRGPAASSRPGVGGQGGGAGTSDEQENVPALLSRKGRGAGVGPIFRRLLVDQGRETRGTLGGGVPSGRQDRTFCVVMPSDTHTLTPSTEPLLSKWLMMRRVQKQGRWSPVCSLWSASLTVLPWPHPELWSPGEGCWGPHLYSEAFVHCRSALCWAGPPSSQD